MTVERANAYLGMKSQQTIQSEGAKSYGQASRWGMFCLPLNEFAAGPMRLPLTMLLIAVGMVLLIALREYCRPADCPRVCRERDLAVRVALGASKARLIRQALVESILLTAAGLVLGFAAASDNCAPSSPSLPVILSAQINLRSAARCCSL